MNLIQNGERPVFACLELVRKVYRDKERSNNEYETVSSSFVIQQIASLYTIAEILFKRNNTQNKNRHDLWNIITTLPLFFDVEMTNKWEKDKVWNKYVSHKPFTISYEESLTVFNLSDAYQIDNEFKKYIWSEWFQKEKTEDLIKVIEFSAKKLLDWENAREQSTLKQNMLLMSKAFSLPEKDISNWSYLYSLTKGNTNIWDLYLKETGEHYPKNYQSLLHIWEKAFHLETGSISQFYLPESPWIKIGFYNQLISPYDDHKVINDCRTMAEISKKLTGYVLPLMDEKVWEPLNFLKLFVNLLSTKTLPIDNWNYIEELPQIHSILKNKIPLKVLIYGEKGMGKSVFVQSLLKHYNLLGLTPLQYKKNDETLLNVKLANYITKNITENGGVLVLDEIEDNFNLQENTKTLINLNAPIQFWITSDLKKFNEKLMNNFNIVIELNEPPLDFKQRIASQYFQDENFATRVAQTVRTIDDIHKIAYWCESTQDFSWKNISTYLSNAAKAKTFLKNDSKSSINLNKIDNKIDLPDLAGYEDLTKLMNKLIYFFKNPNEYKKLGAPSPKGLLLTGSPGTGKTHFVRYLSKITDIPMFAPNSSEMAKVPENISMVFREAKKYAPCILFLDEIDVLINTPMELMTVNLEKQKIINTFLTELDGINSNEGVLVIGATHRSNYIEKAAIRSGRISEVFHIPEPNKNARLKIWEAHLVKKKISAINYELLATASAGFTGADIAEAANKGAVDAVENGQNSITTENLLKACDEVFWGSVSSGTVLNEEQKRLVSYHEAGHALLSWKHNLIVQRITVRPRQTALGAVHYVQEEGIYCMSKDAIVGRIEMMLGGICAEKVKFSYYQNGGVGDLKSAKKLLHHALLEAGLGESGAVFASATEMWSNEKKLALENEEQNIMDTAFSNAENWLKENMDLLDTLAMELLEKREMSGERLNFFRDRVQNNSNNIVRKSYAQLESRTLHKQETIIKD